MRYKLLAIDLDNTLLNSEKKLSEGNKNAIKKAVSSGLNVIICSGRSQTSIAPFNKELELDKENSYGISFNGGVVYRADSGTILHECRLNKYHALKIIDKIKSIHPNAPIMTYLNEDLIYYEFEHDNISQYTDGMAVKSHQIPCFKEFITKDVMKIIILWQPELLEEISKIKYSISEYAIPVFSSPKLLEFNPISSNKFVGLSFLSSYLGINFDEIVAIGDYYNDYEMIKNAGFGVAVKNAVEDLKEIADYVTENDNNNDAIKEVIEILFDK